MIEIVNFMLYIFVTIKKIQKKISTHAFDQELQLPDTSCGKQKGIHTINQCSMP